MFAGYLSDNIKITKVQDHTAAGTSAVNSSSVDMTGYDAVLFVTSFGILTVGGLAASTQKLPGLMTPAFSPAIASIVSPRNC